jgi:hypothetical protein
VAAAVQATPDRGDRRRRNRADGASAHLPHTRFSRRRRLRHAADTANAVAARILDPTVFPTLESAAAADHAIFDIAVPGDQVLSILGRLPPAPPS